jgi:hypothetical protein
MPALIRPPQELVPVGLAAMKAVALAAGTIRPGARRLIVAAQRLLLGTDVDFDAVEPITPEAFASSFTAPATLKQQIVRVAIARPRGHGHLLQRVALRHRLASHGCSARGLPSGR